MIAIIDTNVIYKASIPISKLDGDDLDCAHKCVCFLDRFVKNHANILVLDRGRRILKEYINAYKEFKHMCPGYAIVFLEPLLAISMSFMWMILQKLLRMEIAFANIPPMRGY